MGLRTLFRLGLWCRPSGYNEVSELVAAKERLQGDWTPLSGRNSNHLSVRGSPVALHPLGSNAEMGTSICCTSQSALSRQEGHRSLVRWWENDICRISELKLLRILDQLLTIRAIDMMEILQMS